MIVGAFGFIEGFEGDGLERLIEGAVFHVAKDFIKADPFIAEETAGGIGDDTEIEGFGFIVIADVVDEGEF